MNYAKLTSLSTINPQMYGNLARDKYDEILNHSFLTYEPCEKNIDQLYNDASQRSTIAGLDILNQINGCCSILKVKEVMTFDGFFKILLNDTSDQKRLSLKFYYSEEDHPFLSEKNTPFSWNGLAEGITIANDLLYSGIARWEAFKNYNILLANYFLFNDGISVRIFESPKLYAIPDDSKAKTFFFRKMILRTQLHILSNFIEKPRIANITYNGYQNLDTDRYLIEIFNEFKSRYERRLEEVRSSLNLILN